MSEPALQVEGLHVYYGRSHALQGIDLSLDAGVLALIGRNGMGKTTLCNALCGLVPTAAGTVRIAGTPALGLSPNRVARLGVGYVPQGRRVWRSLSVDEHLRLAVRAKGPWTVARVYETFPRLAERRRNGGAALSGGEQQMLAIGRALLGNPRLLVMDEPTEGLAPVIVQQVEALLRRLAQQDGLAVLLVEQNLGVAATVADRVAVMVNGRVAHEMAPDALAADEALQQRLLGVGRHAAEAADLTAVPEEEAMPRVFAIVRPSEAFAPELEYEVAGGAPPTRFSRAPAPPADVVVAPHAPPPPGIAETVGRVAYVAGTFDTKARELGFIRNRLQAAGLRVTTVDLSTGGKPSPADVTPLEVARSHPGGAAAVFTGERGAAVGAMAVAFERFIGTRRDLGGIISAGGSGGTALATPAMRRLAVGVPRVMVSTVASGDVKRYVGPADICMMYSVTDVQGINRISEQVLGNAAHALVGMMQHAPKARVDQREAIGLTMFGVTTACVQMVQARLEEAYDCLVFHATGTGGESMEKLADSGLLAGVIDVTTTEVADFLVGGTLACTEDRFGAFARRRIPYVGSVGALDMVNFGGLDTVPEKFRGRKLHVHNPQVTLMRTTAAECAEAGRWIAERLNRMEGRVRFLIPEHGVSALDAPGQAFHDPEADRALFEALASGVRQNANRRLVRLPLHVNDPAFADALADAFRQVIGDDRELRR